MLVQCAGVSVETGAGGEALCLDAMGAPAAWVGVADPFEFDPAVAGTAFSAGFVLVGVFWALGKAVELVLRQMRS